MGSIQARCLDAKHPQLEQVSYGHLAIVNQRPVVIGLGDLKAQGEVGSRGVLWDNGELRLLVPLETFQNCWPTGASSKGAAFGSCSNSMLLDDPRFTRGLIWNLDGELEPEELIPIPGHNSSGVRGVADSVGVYVGYSHPSIDTNPEVCGSKVPVVWHDVNQPPVALPVPSEHSNGCAVSASQSGSVTVGHTGTADIDANACLWHKGKHIALDFSEWNPTFSFVMAASDNGVLMGSCFFGDERRDPASCFTQIWTARFEITASSCRVSKPVLQKTKLHREASYPLLNPLLANQLGFTDMEADDESDRLPIPRVLWLNDDASLPELDSAVNLAEKAPGAITLDALLAGYALVGGVGQSGPVHYLLEMEK